MWDMNDVIRIEYKGGFVYHIVFDDGKSGNIDFSEYKSPMQAMKPIMSEFAGRADGARVKGIVTAWEKT